MNQPIVVISSKYLAHVVRTKKKTIINAQKKKKNLKNKI